MAKFFVAITEDSMASQIAFLINNHNRLYRFHNRDSLKRGTADYFVEVYGDTVVGCAGVECGISETKIKHVCVLPAFRQRGIAKKLVTTAMSNCMSSSYLMTIRADNVVSLQMAKSLRFFQAGSRWHKDHYVITVRRQIHGEHQGRQGKVYCN